MRPNRFRFIQYASFIRKTLLKSVFSFVLHDASNQLNDRKSMMPSQPQPAFDRFRPSFGWVSPV
jgi:hypothetical protein